MDPTSSMSVTGHSCLHEFCTKYSAGGTSHSNSEFTSEPAADLLGICTIETPGENNTPTQRSYILRW